MIWNRNSEGSILRDTKTTVSKQQEWAETYKSVLKYDAYNQQPELSDHSSQQGAVDL